MKTVAAAALALVIAASAFGGAKTDPGLDKLAKDFAAAFNQKDAAKIAGFYADDAVLMPPNLPAVRGRAAIEAYYKGGFATELGRLTLEPAESSIAGTHAFEAGVSTLTTRGKADKGKYVVVYKRVGSEWKLAYDIFNDDTQPTR